MALVNVLLGIAGLLLEAALLMVFSRQRLLRRFAIFCVVLVFYLLRAPALLLAVRFASHGEYATLFSALSLVDFVLQAGLAVWLFFRIEDSGPEVIQATPRKPLRLVALPLGVMLACGGTWLAMLTAPSYSPVPVDRAAIFSGLLFLALFFWACLRKGDEIAWTLSAGFAAVGFATIVSQIGKSAAAFHHEPRLYLFWAYLDAAVWLLVVVFWLVRFTPRGHRVSGRLGFANNVS